MDLSGKSVLMIVAPTEFRDEEYFDPKAVLEGYGAEVITGSTAPEAESKAGKKIKVDIMLGEIISAKHDALIFVGGAGAAMYFAMEKAHKIAFGYHEEGKPIGAICIAPSIFANAGLLDGKKATSFASEQDTLRKQGADYTGNPVEVDGKIITANGPKAAKQFGEEIAKALVE